MMATIHSNIQGVHFNQVNMIPLFGLCTADVTGNGLRVQELKLILLLDIIATLSSYLPYA